MPHRSDQDELAALLHDYADAIDDGDLAALGALFCHGRLVTEDGQELAAGADAVAAFYRGVTRLHPDGTPRTAHIVTNVSITVEDPDTASARSRFTVLQALEGLPLQPIITGRYRDRFQRADGRWWFAERCMIPTLTGDLGAHLLIDLDPS